MNAIDVAKLVTETQTAHHYKQKKDGTYTAKPYGEGRGTLLDSFSASAIVGVYSNVRDDLKKKMETMKIEKLAIICFKVLKKP